MAANGRYRCAHKCKNCTHDWYGHFRLLDLRGVRTTLTVRSCINGMEKLSKGRRRMKHRRLAEEDDDSPPPAKSTKHSALGVTKKSAQVASGGSTTVLEALQRAGSKSVASSKSGSRPTTHMAQHGKADDDELPSMDELFSDSKTSTAGKPVERSKFRQPVMRVAPLPARRSKAPSSPSASGKGHITQDKSGEQKTTSKSGLDRFRSTAQPQDEFDEFKTFTKDPCSSSALASGGASGKLFRASSSDAQATDLDASQEAEVDELESSDDDAQQAVTDYDLDVDFPAYREPSDTNTKGLRPRATTDGSHNAAVNVGAAQSQMPEVAMEDVQAGEPEPFDDFMAWCEQLVVE